MVAGVVVFVFPKENLGAPDVAGALPNNPPPAGAVLVVLLGAALEELGVVKRDMAIVASLSSFYLNRRWSRKARGSNL